jgi:hypothetical protein
VKGQCPHVQLNEATQPFSALIMDLSEKLQVYSIKIRKVIEILRMLHGYYKEYSNAPSSIGRLLQRAKIYDATLSRFEKNFNKLYLTLERREENIIRDEVNSCFTVIDEIYNWVESSGTMSGRVRYIWDSEKEGNYVQEMDDRIKNLNLLHELIAR